MERVKLFSDPLKSCITFPRQVSSPVHITRIMKLA